MERVAQAARRILREEPVDQAVWGGQHLGQAVTASTVGGLQYTSSNAASTANYYNALATTSGKSG